MDDLEFKDKYLKYKKKYLDLKREMSGGMQAEATTKGADEPVMASVPDELHILMGNKGELGKYVDTLSGKHIIMSAFKTPSLYTSTDPTLKDLALNVYNPDNLNYDENGNLISIKTSFFENPKNISLLFEAEEGSSSDLRAPGVWSKGTDLYNKLRQGDLPGFVDKLNEALNIFSHPVIQKIAMAGKLKDGAPTLNFLADRIRNTFFVYTKDFAGDKKEHSKIMLIEAARSSGIELTSDAADDIINKLSLRAWWITGWSSIWSSNDRSYKYQKETPSHEKQESFSYHTETLVSNLKLTHVINSNSSTFNINDPGRAGRIRVKETEYPNFMRKIAQFHDSNETGEPFSTMYADLYGAIQLTLWMNSIPNYNLPSVVVYNLKQFIDYCEKSDNTVIQKDFEFYFKSKRRIPVLNVYTDYYENKNEVDDALAILAFCNMATVLNLYFDKPEQCDLFKKNVGNYLGKPTTTDNYKEVDSLTIQLMPEY